MNTDFIARCMAGEAQSQIEGATEGFADLDTRLDSMDSTMDINKAALVELVDSGAKNFIAVNFTSRAAGTDKPSITNNGDGSITVDGSRESTSATILVYDISSDATVSTDTTYTLPVGKYVIAATGNTKLKLQVYMHNGTDLVALGTSGADIAEFEYTSENKTTYPYICWRINANGASTFDNYTFSPMICSKSAWDISQTYQPYRPSYQELYEMVLALQA